MSLSLIPYLVMDGNAKEAIGFYKEALNAELVMQQTFGEMPESGEFPISDEDKDKIMHATLQVGESQLMFADNVPGQPHQIGNQVTICISTNEKDKSTAMYEALEQGGNVIMPLQETFFSPAFGMVTDKFGVTFQIHTQGE